MTPDLILNIGLDTADGQRLTLDRVFEAVASLFPGAGIVIELHQSDTEPTAVVSIPIVGIRPNLVIVDLFAPLHGISTELHQDCIAFRYRNSSVGLIGPRADKWLPFDPAKFIMPTTSAKSPHAMTDDELADEILYELGVPRLGEPLVDVRGTDPVPLSMFRISWADGVVKGVHPEPTPAVDWRAEAQKLADALSTKLRDPIWAPAHMIASNALADFEALKKRVDRG